MKASKERRVNVVVGCPPYRAYLNLQMGEHHRYSAPLPIHVAAMMSDMTRMIWMRWGFGGLAGMWVSNSGLFVAKALSV